MKKLMFVIGIIIISCIPLATVYAGSLNQYEQDVISSARKTYEYNGKQYRVDKVFIAQLEEYLSSEGIDLTEEQRDEVLHLAFANVERGVKDGYLIPVEEAAPTLSTPSPEDDPASDNTTSQGNAGTDNGQTQSEDPSSGTVPAQGGSTAPDSTPAQGGNTASDAAGSQDSNTSLDGNASPGMSATLDSTSQGMESGTDSSASGVHINDNNTTNTASPDKEDDTDPATPEEIVDNVLGSTQENIQAEEAFNSQDGIQASTIIISAVLGLLLLTGIICILHYYARGRNSRKKNGFIRAGGFIDIHTHILPGVDDGSRSMDQTIRMLHLAHAQQIDTIIATSHYAVGAKNIPPEELMSLKDRVQEEARKINKDMRILLGHELYYSDSIRDMLKAKQALTLAGSRYILVEFSPKESYNTMYKGLAGLIQAGYIPIIAHIERYHCVHKKDHLINDLVRMGCYIQMNCNSLSGGIFDRAVRRNRKLLKLGLVHLLGSDCHDDKIRVPNIGTTVNILQGRYEVELLDRVLYRNPACIIENTYI